MGRRQEFAQLIPQIVRSVDSPISLGELYAQVAIDRPDLVDDELEQGTGRVRWKHELRWEVESLVRTGEIRRRKDLGRGIYSAT